MRSPIGDRDRICIELCDTANILHGSFGYAPSCMTRSANKSL
jgi:hypothetical protein